jgi:hypothetical protein
MISDTLSNECGPSRYNIPAPVIRNVLVSDLAGNRHPEPWEGLIDTGADRSIIPITICQELHLAPRDFRCPRGFDPDASTRVLPRYYVRVNVANLGEFTLLVYGVRRSNVLLGRDFLSELVLLLDSSKDHYTLGRHTFCSNLIVAILRLA